MNKIIRVFVFYHSSNEHEANRVIVKRRGKRTRYYTNVTESSLDRLAYTSEEYRVTASYDGWGFYTAHKIDRIIYETHN